MTENKSNQMNTDKNEVTGSGIALSEAIAVAGSWAECDSGELLGLHDQRCIGVLLDSIGELKAPLNHLAALIKTAEAGRKVVLTSGVRKAVRTLIEEVTI